MSGAGKGGSRGVDWTGEKRVVGGMRGRDGLTHLEALHHQWMQTREKRKLEIKWSEEGKQANQQRKQKTLVYYSHEIALLK